MNSKQTMILWIGLALILLNLVRDWGAIKGVLSTGSSGNISSGSKLPSSGPFAWVKWITSWWNPVSHGIL